MLKYKKRLLREILGDLKERWKLFKEYWKEWLGRAFLLLFSLSLLTFSFLPAIMGIFFLLNGNIPFGILLIVATFIWTPLVWYSIGW